ncbi:MAG: NAD-glutamate dehydrogenase [Hyphomicrobiales bacterium]|nr:NAD-glutamate dehydrogenase [Hyphomicrobiales bacterium]
MARTPSGRTANPRPATSAPDIPPDAGDLKAFTDLLFAHVAAEDIAAHDRDDLGRFAAGALAQLRTQRLPHTTRVNLRDETVSHGGVRRELTIIEVVNDNMPFLLDSTLSELAEQGLEPKLVAHPIVAVARDEAGGLVRMAGDASARAPEGTLRESLIHIHIEALPDPAPRERLIAGLNRVYADVRVAVDDWSSMRTRLGAAMQAYRNNPPPLPEEEMAEAMRFLDWISGDNFTFLGMREYRFAKGSEAADQVGGTGLGILRDPSVMVLRRGRDLVATTPEIRAFLNRPQALIITKANVKSRVHRRVHLDYVGIKLFTADGRLDGELRIVGLLTSSAYTGTAASVPYLRLKVAQVARMAGFDQASYSGRSLMNVLDSYPRDELFQINVETLHRFALDIQQLTERPRIRALARIDEFDRFVSVLVYIPKDRYDTSVRRRVGDFLCRVFAGRLSAAYPAYPEGPLARTHYIIGRDDGDTPRIDRATLEAGISAIVRTWADGLKEALARAKGDAKARLSAERYADAFGAAYRENFAATEALEDIAILDTLSVDKPRAVDFYRREGDPSGRVNLKVFTRATPMPLSQRVPMLENMGFTVVNERTYRIVPAGSSEAERVWLHDMALERTAGGQIDIAVAEPAIEAALMAQFAGLTEPDRYDALVLEAGLAWRDVALMRALGRYLRQVGVPYGQDYLAGTLARHRDITRTLARSFHNRFDPRIEQAARSHAAPELAHRLDQQLSAVSSLDDDRILRRFANLIDAALRTNYFQIGSDGFARPVIAFKFDSGKVEGLPAPRPLYEIFVYSPRVEGVHLRFGKVARGGLRWSDRPQDFRTEVLGLVKAQQVKNAVIVPVGAKGGFVPKQLPPASDRAAWFAEGTESYRVFVRTLLELTDNLDGERIVPPANTRRYDGDDPYLVVAADKGTATFSDTANALSAEKGHWLGDAFASGGSQGYDHKKMGITARGAWEAVKRHFREIDHDIQVTPFTVAGVGDMSGDVFGNGMLLSPVIRLVAAFDHRDIFLDPNPDVAVSLKERERLFTLPRSSWQDYDASLISVGGGVFPRSAKSVPLCARLRQLLDLDKPEATPQEVMSAILKARVDLLWFGGIGTYIRASGETDAEVGDRANDAIRITGLDLRAKVVGEGANLGATQRGRIEAARAGVRLNTDAIDNSAGVNTSDVEVNIKIALTAPERDGRLTPDTRNALLAAMTDEVALLVLRNNYLQSLALSLAERRGAAELPLARAQMRTLEREGRLDRAVEFLPADAVLAGREQRQEGMTRPELAVLLAYAKLALYDDLLSSPLPDEPYLANELTRYFPGAMRERFADAITGHRLRREIISTQLANAVVNRAGAGVVARLSDETGADTAAIARAYILTRDAFGLLDINLAIDRLDAMLGGATQLALYGAVQETLVARMVWFLRNADVSQPLEEQVRRFGAGVAAIAAAGTSLATDQARRSASIKVWTEAGVPGELATRIVDLHALQAAPDGVLIAEQSGAAVSDAVSMLFGVTEAFGAGQLKQAGAALHTTDRFERLAIDRAVERIDLSLRAMSVDVLRQHGEGRSALDAWRGLRPAGVAQFTTSLADLLDSGLTPAKLSVAASLMDDLARSVAKR